MSHKILVVDDSENIRSVLQMNFEWMGYDVVAANPPYMGSKNMGPILKKFVERHFSLGKRDLYAAFILRCLQLAGDSGRVSMVTQQEMRPLPLYTGAALTYFAIIFLAASLVRAAAERWRQKVYA